MHRDRAEAAAVFHGAAAFVAVRAQHPLPLSQAAVTPQ